MTTTTPTTKPTNLSQCLEEAIESLNTARRQIAELQTLYAAHDGVWIRLEAIDDQLFDALTKLGD